MEIKCNTRLEELLYLSEKKREVYIEKLEMLNAEFSFPFKNAKYKVKDRFYWTGYALIAFILIIVVTLLSKADNKTFYLVLTLISLIPIVIALIFYKKAKNNLKNVQKDYDSLYQPILSEYKETIFFDAKAAFLVPAVIFCSEKQNEISKNFQKQNCKEFVEYLTENILKYKNDIYENKKSDEESKEEVLLTRLENIYLEYYKAKEKEVFEFYKKENLENFLSIYMTNASETFSLDNLEDKRDEIEEIVNYYKEWKYSITGYQASDNDKKARLMIAYAKSKRKNNDIDSRGEK
ncbi:MAG: hypothetical protein ACOX4W_00945 [Bacilli bacterium]